jgi:hypothetical protein
LTSAAFWMALAAVFLLLSFAAKAGVALEPIRIRKERGVGPRGSAGESGIAPDLRKAA